MTLPSHSMTGGLLSGCYNKFVSSRVTFSTQHLFRTGKGIDLAFALVVLASFFATASAIHQATSLEIALMVIFGTFYLMVGIYGYHYCVRSRSLALQLAYFAVQIPLGGLLVYLGKGAGYNAIILLPLVGHSVLMLPGKWDYWVNTAILLSYVLSIRLFHNGENLAWSDLFTFLAGQIFIVAFTRMAVNEERARNDVERLARELSDANQHLRKYALQVEELATTRERNRLAREIHDGLGHYLTTINMQIQAANAVMPTDPQRSQQALKIAQNLAQEALVDVRRSVAALRASPEEDLLLDEQLDKIAEHCRLMGVEPHLETLGNPRLLPAPAQHTLYRAAQEGINNTLKHAHASHIWISFDYTQNDRVRLSIRDNGLGQVDFKEGFGLMGVKERVHLLGGKFNASSVDGQGFALEVEIPL